jgi:HK97 family phage prohead protease
MKHVRFIPNSDCGLRVREASEGEQSRVVEGTPIIFGVRSVNLTPWSDSKIVYEVLERGCIAPDLISKSDIILNVNHSSKVTDVLGRCREGKGTLEIGLNADNVECSCDLPKTNTADDALELIKRGDISGMSFAFTDDWEDTENGVSYERTDEVVDGKEVWLRHVKKITGLYDVSIVTYPAYEQTSVGTREQGDKILERIEAQIKASENPKGKTKEEERELEEQAEKARIMQMQRLRYQRRRAEENFK